jgi:chromosome segregation ATPase
VTRSSKPAASSETDRAQLAEQRASLAKESARVERAIERYQDAFENGDLDPVRFKERLSALDTRLDALQAQDQALAHELAADMPTTPDTAALHAVADQLAHVIANGDTDQTKALLRILIAERENNLDKVVLHAVCDEPFPWTVEELEREHQNRDVGDSVRRLAEAGLVYRVRVEIGGRLGQGRGVEPPLHQEFVLPTRAGRKADEIEAGSG